MGCRNAETEFMQICSGLYPSALPVPMVRAGRRRKLEDHVPGPGRPDPHHLAGNAGRSGLDRPPGDETFASA